MKSPNIVPFFLIAFLTLVQTTFAHTQSVATAQPFGSEPSTTSQMSDNTTRLRVVKPKSKATADIRSIADSEMRQAHAKSDFNPTGVARFRQSGGTTDKSSP